MKRVMILVAILASVNLITAQNGDNIDKYMTAMVASDTILDGNTFEYKVIIRNLKGDFTPPTFANFDIVGGPNMSTSMQYTNGDMFREMTYTYHLKARKVGEHYIEEAYLEIDDGNIETEAISIFVVDNPEEIQKDYRISPNTKSELVFPFGKIEQDEKKTTKPKRKLKKI